MDSEEKKTSSFREHRGSIGSSESEATMINPVT